mmetsp:Transcript_4322/g.7491  ORF Transcript_4322/g.7491 Transcript_4322/m.7491 type:complete len:535 (-) Transcript_4322:122-1726(-)
MSDPLLYLPIHAPQDSDPQRGYKYKHSLSAGITPAQSNQQTVHINPIEVHRFFRNLSRGASKEYNPNIMANDNTDQQGVKPSAGERVDLATPALSICSSSRSASPTSHISSNVAMAAAMNKKNRQKNDKAVEVLNKNSVVIARFRTQTECAKYLQATPEAVSYHCSKKGGGICNGLVIRPCDNSDDIEFGLFDGAEEVRPKRRPQLKPETVDILKRWILSPDHKNNPYPTVKETATLMRKTGLDKTQLKHWFNNARKRILKPMLKKEKAASLQAEPPAPSPVVQEKRKAAPERKMKRPAKKTRVESDVENSDSSGTAGPSEAQVSQFGIMFGSERAGAGTLNAMHQEDSMAMGMTGTLNALHQEDSMAMGMTGNINPMSLGFNQAGPSAAAATAMMGMSGIPFDNSSDFLRNQSYQGISFGNNSFPPQQHQHQHQQIQPSPVVFKQQVASMAMKEATIAFKNMEDAYAMAKEIMSILSASGSITNIEEDPRVIDATAHAKKLHSVAMFKLKVSKRASEEAEKAFETMQGFHRLS